MDKPVTPRPHPIKMKYLNLSTWLTLLAVILYQSTSVKSQVCSARADIALIIDTSGSINEVTENWPTVVDFLIRVINQLDIGPDMIQVGAVQFSDNEVLEWRLDQYFDRNSMINGVRDIVYQGGRTNLAGGLEIARNRIFNTNAGDRPGVPNIALVITDGIPNERENETIPQANLLKSVVDLIVCVGVTDQIDRQLLEDIASSPSDVIRVENFDALTRDLSRIVSQVCPTLPPQPVCTTALDIALIIDTSGSINEVTVNWPTVIDFLIRLVNQLDIGQNSVRVGAVQFSDDELLEWTLSQYYNLNALISAIRNIPYQGGRTNLAGGLELARTVLFNENSGDRPDVPNVALVITDGIPNERVTETLPQANQLKSVVDLVVCVGVTDAIDVELLEQVASSSQDVIRVENFDALKEDLSRIVDQVCATTPPPPPPAG